MDRDDNGVGRSKGILSRPHSRTPKPSSSLALHKYKRGWGPRFPVGGVSPIPAPFPFFVTMYLAKKNCPLFG